MRHRGSFARRSSLALLGALTLALTAAPAHAQDGGSDAGDASDGGAAPGRSCPSGALQCDSAPIQFVRRQGLPVELDFDTSWVPASSPVQVRVRAAFVGHTEVRAGGSLDVSWPRAMQLEAPPGPAMSGVLESDYGIVFTARVRIHVTISGTTYDWEGNVPYVPQVDFRSTARGNFDPWAWRRTSVRGTTMQQRIADVSLTDSLIPIPGISGGLSFSARAALETGYRSTRISFAPATDAITESVARVTLPFAGGAIAEFSPRLEGEVDQRVDLTITPSLYISLLGRRWDIPIVDVPVPINTGARPWLFDPQTVRFSLPDIAPLPSVIDFGDVTVGESKTESVTIDNRGGASLALLRSTDINSAPFAWELPRIEIPFRSMRAVEMRFAPTSVGAFETRVPLVTSDPDSPTVYITARGRGVMAIPSMPDASAPDATPDASADAAAPDAATPPLLLSGDGACACSVAARPTQNRLAPLAALASLALALASRRARRRR